MRCLCLADELKLRGYSCTFLAAELSAGIGRRILDRGHEIQFIREAPLAPWSLQDDARTTFSAIRRLAPQWLVVDHYELDADWERAVCHPGTNVLVIEDTPNREHECDLLLDQTPGRLAAHYQALLPARCELLTGSRFALVRREFALARESAMSRRRSASPTRVLASFGGTDPQRLSVRLLSVWPNVVGPWSLHLVVGDSAQLAALQPAADAHRIRVTANISDMAPALSGADLAIGSVGVSALERCAVGLPSIVVPVADNQRETAARLRELEAAVELDTQAILDVKRLHSALEFIVDRYQTMVESCFELVDCLGAGRVADAMVQMPGNSR